MARLTKLFLYVLHFSFLFIAVLGLVGCSEDSAVSPTQQPVLPIRTLPSSAWHGIQWSFDQNDPVGWEDMISPSFVYTPDPTSQAKFPNTFDSWGQAAELNFVGVLFSAGLEFNASMLSGGYVPPTPSGSEVVWGGVEYSVQVQGETTSCPVVYRGVANLEFRIEGNFWYLTSWTDIRGAAASWNSEVILPTLGELRAVFAE